MTVCMCNYVCIIIIILLLWVIIIIVKRSLSCCTVCIVYCISCLSCLFVVVFTWFRFNFNHRFFLFLYEHCVLLELYTAFSKVSIVIIIIIMQQ